MILLLAKQRSRGSHPTAISLSSHTQSLQRLTARLARNEQGAPPAQGGSRRMRGAGCAQRARETARSASLSCLRSSGVQPDPSLRPHTEPQSRPAAPTRRAKRPRSARSSRPEVASATQRSASGKAVPLTHGFQDCLGILQSPGREADPPRGCEETAAGFCRLCLTNLPNAERESEPLRAARVFRGRGRTLGPPARRPARGPRDVTRALLGRHAPSSRLERRRPLRPLRRSGVHGGPSPKGGDWRGAGTP